MSNRQPGFFRWTFKALDSVAANQSWGSTGAPGRRSLLEVTTPRGVLEARGRERQSPGRHPELTEKKMKRAQNQVSDDKIKNPEM